MAKTNYTRASARKHHLVYKTTCLISGRYYIGLHSTDDLEDGYLGSGRRLQNSLKKHGRDNHTRTILEECSSRQHASDREAEIITDEMRKDPLCLNCGPGGLGAKDRPTTSEETRAKLSIASKRFVRTKEHYEKVVATRKAKNNYSHTDEVKAKMTASLTGRTLSEEHKANIGKSNIGRTFSDETRAKIGQAIKANAKAGLRKPMKPRTDEHRLKLSLKAKEQWANCRVTI